MMCRRAESQVGGGTIFNVAKMQPRASATLSVWGGMDGRRRNPTHNLTRNQEVYLR